MRSVLRPSTKLVASHVEENRSGISRPTVVVHRDGLLPGVLMLVLAVIWIGVPLRATALIDAEPIPGLGTTGTLMAFAIGAGFALWGLEALTRRRRIAIDDHSVTVRDRRLGVVREWRTPLADYIGIEVRSESIRTPRGRRSLHRVELRHRDRERSLTLAVSKDPRQALHEHSLLAQALGLGQPKAAFALDGCRTAASVVEPGSRPVAPRREPAPARV